MYRHDHFLALPEDVITFAWSAPMRELAQRVGISDVGLKKLLRLQGIITPPQGYWNKVHAGKDVPAPPEPPPRGPGANGRVRLDGRFCGHVPEAGRMPVDGPFDSTRVPENLEELRRLERKALGKVTVPRDLARPHPGLSDVLGREEKRRAKFEKNEWAWDRPKHDHPLARRQLRIADGLLKALAKRDHQGSLCESETGFELVATVGDMGLTLTIEQIPDRRRASIQMDDRQVRELPASTPLKIGLRRSWRRGESTEWKDEAKARLEPRLADIVASVIVAGEAAFRRSLVEAVEAERQQRAWQEEEWRREIARLEEQRLADLRSSGELLRQAEEIRILVARVEKAMLQGSAPSISRERVACWKTWALAQADALDPVVSLQVLKHLHVPELDDS